jgi:hypothetical protein
MLVWEDDMADTFYEKAGGNRWRVVVELTIDVQRADLIEKAPGDVPADFARRAFEARLRPVLDAMQLANNVAHYHVMEAPKACWDL